MRYIARTLTGWQVLRARTTTARPSRPGRDRDAPSRWPCRGPSRRGLRGDAGARARASSATACGTVRSSPTTWATPHLKQVDLLLGQMHGDEHAGVRVANALVHGTRAARRHEPVGRPDHEPRRRRRAHPAERARRRPQPQLARELAAPDRAVLRRVARPLSEPETRAMYAFLRNGSPALHRVAAPAALRRRLDRRRARIDPAFRNRLAKNLGLPDQGRSTAPAPATAR